MNENEVMVDMIRNDIEIHINLKVHTSWTEFDGNINVDQTNNHTVII